MSNWAQLFWPVDRELPDGNGKLYRDYFKRKNSILTKYLASTREMGQKVQALSAEWENKFDELSTLYDDAAPTLEGHSLARWLSDIDYCVELSSDEVEALGIQSLMTCTEWDFIEDEGAFPDFPSAWAAPGDVEKACENLLGLLNDCDETALRAREIYVNGRHSADDPRLADESWRKEREREFEAELRQMAENAAKCQDRGITKVGFLIYR